jgi:hypothetical protein
MQRALPLSLALLPASLLAQSAPVHHWPLDEAVGMQVADIVGGSDGTLVGGVTLLPTAGWYGGAAAFDGANDRIEFGPCDITTGTGGFGVSLWVRLELMTGSEQLLFGKSDGPAASDWVWSVSQVNSTALRFRLRLNGTVHELTTGGASLFSGSWYHVAAGYDGSAMRIHINGALMATQPASGMMPFVPTAPTVMGGRTDGTLAFMGRLDDVRLYDHGLGDTEIIDIILGDVVTSIAQRPAVTTDPSGDLFSLHGWEPVRAFDACGRVVRERNARTNAPFLLDGPPGLYLVCLQRGREEAIVLFLKP